MRSTWMMSAHWSCARWNLQHWKIVMHFLLSSLMQRNVDKCHVSATWFTVSNRIGQTRTHTAPCCRLSTSTATVVRQFAVRMKFVETTSEAEWIYLFPFNFVCFVPTFFRCLKLNEAHQYIGRALSISKHMASPVLCALFFIPFVLFCILVFGCALVIRIHCIGFQLCWKGEKCAGFFVQLHNTKQFFNWYEMICSLWLLHIVCKNDTGHFQWKKKLFTQHSWELPSHLSNKLYTNEMSFTENIALNKGVLKTVKLLTKRFMLKQRK